MKTEIKEILKENWRAIQTEDEEWAVIEVEEKPSFGTLYVCQDICQGHDNGEAHAKLIAAAPDLLKAVQSLLAMMERGAKPKKLNEALTWRENDELARSEAKAAIKKATK